MPIDAYECHQSYRIICCLISMGYAIHRTRDVIRVIENENLDRSQFDFPYGSFEIYKQHVLDGEFDIDATKHLMPDEIQSQLQQVADDDQLWTTY